MPWRHHSPRTNTPKVFSSPVEEIAYIDKIRIAIDEKILILQQRMNYYYYLRLRSMPEVLPSEIPFNPLELTLMFRRSLPRIKRRVFTSSIEELIYLNQASTTINEKIRLLQQRKADFGRRLNQLQPTIRNLPSEILSEIFLYIYHDISDKHPLFCLLSICNHWYQTARSTPRLWSMLLLKLDTRKALKDVVDRLQIWFTNIGAVPLTLELLVNEWLTERELAPVTEFLSFKDNVGKIGELRLNYPILGTLSEILPSCMGIRQLVLNDTASKYLLFEYFQEWSFMNLTTLQIQNIKSFSEFIPILIQCRHTLTELSVSFRVHGLAKFVIQKRPITLHRLRILRTQVCYILPKILTFLRFPILETFELDVDEQFHTGPQPYYLNYFDELLSVLPKCSPTSIRISLAYFRQWGHFYRQLLIRSHRLQEFVLYDDYLWPTNDSTSILYCLSEPEVIEILPPLRRLVIRQMENWFSEEGFRALLNMMEIRRVGFVEPFHLEVQVLTVQAKCELDCLVKWLRKQGCKITMEVKVLKP